MCSTSATRWSARLICRLERGTDEDEEVEAPEPAAPPFKEFAARWLDEYVIANRHSPATVEGRQKCLRTHLLPLLGERSRALADDLNRAQVDTGVAGALQQRREERRVRPR